MYICNRDICAAEVIVIGIPAFAFQLEMCSSPINQGIVGRKLKTIWTLKLLCVALWQVFSKLAIDTADINIIRFQYRGRKKCWYHTHCGMLENISTGRMVIISIIVTEMMEVGWLMTGVSFMYCMYSLVGGVGGVISSGLLHWRLIRRGSTRNEHRLRGGISKNIGGK